VIALNPAARDTLIFSQTLLTILALTLAATLVRRSWGLGSLAAVLVAIKPIMAVVPVYFVVGRMWRPLAISLFVLGLLVLTSYWIFPAGTFSTYLTSG